MGKKVTLWNMNQVVNIVMKRTTVSKDWKYIPSIDVWDHTWWGGRKKGSKRTLVDVYEDISIGCAFEEDIPRPYWTAAEVDEFYGCAIDPKTKEVLNNAILIITFVDGQIFKKKFQTNDEMMFYYEDHIKIHMKGIVDNILWIES